MLRRRQLKKEKLKHKTRNTIIILFCLFGLLIIIEYIYLNFSLGRSTYISPVAKNQTSKTILFENQLEKSNIKFSTVTASSDGSFIVVLNAGGEVIFSSKKDIRSQISSLQLMLARLTIEGKRLKILDFRFDNPVVSF